MEKDQIDSLAEKIAQVIASASPPPGLASMQKSIELINERLSRLEKASNGPTPQRTHQIAHPSQDRFEVAEAIVDSLFNRDAKEKACTFEPNDRPCDHCSMCSARGF